VGAAALAGPTPRFDTPEKDRAIDVLRRLVVLCQVRRDEREAGFVGKPVDIASRMT
jgi:hypothetical protein